MSIGLFRVMGSLGRNMIVANTFGSFAMLVVMALGGYIISRGQTKPFLIFIFFCNFHLLSLFVETDSVPSWWIWGFWFSPLMYAQNAASVNEFLGHSWDKVICLSWAGYIHWVIYLTFPLGRYISFILVWHGVAIEKMFLGGTHRM